MLINQHKPMKEAYAVAVGGMIAFGKTTLIDALRDYYPNSQSVYELREGDMLQDLLLKGLYDKTVAAEVFQLYFLTTRFAKYKNTLTTANRGQLIFFDRTIFEDRLFAHQNMMNRPVQFSYYDNLWRDLLNELLYLIGTPMVYIILTGSFKLFKERIYKRGRQVEIENWDLNENYFRNLHSAYESFMVSICNMYGINYAVIDVENLTPDQVRDKAVAVIDEKINSFKHPG